MKKWKGRKTIVQNHFVLSVRIRRMAQKVMPEKDATADEKKRYADLIALAEDHARKGSMFGKDFIMIL